MNRLPRFLLLGPLVLACAAIFWAQAPGSWRGVAAIGAALLGGISAIAAVRFSFGLLGAALCILPMLGSGVLSVFLSGWLFGCEVRLLCTGEHEERTSSERAMVLGFLALLLCLLGSALPPLLTQFDLPLLRAVSAAGGLKALWLLAESSRLPLLEVPRGLAGYILALLLAAAFCRLQRIHHAGSWLLGGLCGGAFGAGIVLLLQYYDVDPIFSINRGAFWRYVERYSASFSDPNAFGVFVLLAAPLLWFAAAGPLKRWARSAALLLLLCVLWSGSRTVWLGLFLWVLVLFARRLRLEESNRNRCLAAAALAAVLLAPLLAGAPPVNEALQRLSPPAGAARLLETLHWREGAERLNSRVVYSRIAAAMWLQRPLCGVGLGEFYHLQRGTALQIGIDLKDWRDNANNFYLQILSEGGAVGFAVLMLSFVFFSKALSPFALVVPPIEASYSLAAPRELQRLSRASMGIFAAVLLLGPHTFFEEVRYAAALLLAFGVCYAALPNAVEIRAYQRRLMAATLVVPVVYIGCFLAHDSYRLARGFYGIEEGGDGPVRWTASRAYFSLCSAGPRVRTFEFSAPRPDIREKPVELQLARRNDGRFETLHSLQIRDPAWVQLYVPPLQGEEQQAVEQYRIRALPLWNPSGGSSRGDVRWLGVMMKWPEGACE